ncbi:MAG: 3-isopropylmalate dehydratase [Labilithrix sp.]|nr:3-isopropylmalate dehydratase [Labilithrix sp.]MCW5813605.1 3-isopropylmalate dehydratase [Labilithrix sp.]
MAQKILAGRCADPMLAGSQVSVKVDQIVLTRAPLRAIAEAREAGLKKTTAEVAIVYDTHCAGSAASRAKIEDIQAATPEILGHGIVIARPGIGYPAPVHLERFASPARLCVTDDPRLAGVGGIGMLTIVVPPGQLGAALATGSITLRPPRSVQVLLSGRTRPFICARDIAHELVRRGLGEAVARIEAAHAAPVVIEFAGPSARLLSVGERAVLAGIAPQLGAAGAVFVSDERTEVFLRDQRRSKAHRALVPDAGAPCDEVLNVDLGAVDPLFMDETGQVRTVRDVAGKPVTQVLLGGDSGCTLRDLAAAALLLKSKRVPARVEFLVAIPSRQMLEVLSSTGALTDLIATGARIIEPDARVMTGELYPPVPGGFSARTQDLEPGATIPKPVAVASAEALAWAVAYGEMGDPRSFKRPVRVTIPRALPTDDVLVVRDKKGAAGGDPKKPAAITPLSPTPWKGGATLDLVEGPAHLANGAAVPTTKAASTKQLPSADGVAVVCSTLDEVREITSRAQELASNVRAVVAPFIPSGSVAVFSGLGIAALKIDAAAAKSLKGQRSIALPEPSKWSEKGPTTVSLAGSGAQKVQLSWLALGSERAWASAGTARPSVSRSRT